VIALLIALQAASAPEEPVLDPPTLHCLGAYWIIRGDANRNAKVEVAVRKAGGEWTKAMPFLRVERGASHLKVADDAWLFAGSVVDLHPDTPYELRLTLVDPDGGGVEKVLAARTIAEPVAPKDLTEVHVRPGKDALRDAQREAKPGTLVLLHAGVYEGTFDVFRSGEAGKPIVFRAAGDGEAVIDAKGQSNAILAAGLHDVWFEGLTVRNGLKGLTISNSSRVVVRRCTFEAVTYGVVGTVNEKGDVHGHFISDNSFTGPCTWPRTKGIEAARAIQVTGQGHVVCYNRIRGFADAVDTMPSTRCAAIDVHNNEISEMTDDGIEMDYSERNTRCFRNRLTNVFQGISEQPVHGGPVYIFRNVLVNVCAEPFKLHNSPTGVFLYHNTIVKKGSAFFLSTEHPVRSVVSRNNLFVGSSDTYGIHNETRMVDCDFDGDGIAGGPWKIFMKWGDRRYATPDEARAKAPAYRRPILLDAAGLFAAPVTIEDETRQLSIGFNGRLKEGAGAIDAGEPTPGMNDGFAGKAPDLGAHEAGAEPPHYGPRPAK
jgi:hypothetical protein